MTQTPANRYHALEAILLRGRELEGLSGVEDERISEEMAGLWYQMTDLERQDAKERISPYVKSLLEQSMEER